MEVRIRPNRSWVSVDWAGLWQYRDLLFLLVRKDFVSRYSQTILGPLWSLIQPLVTTLLFTVIFGNFGKMPTDGLPPLLFYLCGMLPWSYFAATFNGTSSTLLNNAGLFGKVYFPRLLVPISATLSCLIPLLIQSVMFAAFWCYYKYQNLTGPALHFGGATAILPLIAFQVGALGLGFGLWMSALTAKYRDFLQVSAFVVNVWMYATPVVFPLSMIPEERRWIVMLNPMTMPVEAFKLILLGQGTVTLSHCLASLFVTMIVFCSGVFVFQHVERTFVDVI